MDNKVKFLRGTATEYEASTKDNDTFYYTTDDEKLYLGNKEITGGGVTIDDTLSDTSKNPVQNKVINAALNSKADQTTVDNALAQKANSADVTASLAGKSDIGHTHDDRYYTESETNTLLGDKVGVSDFNSHTNNTTVHVTAEEKAAWNGKAELSDIPSSLPANGGNSDTIDGKHADEFIYARGYFDSIDLNEIRYPCSGLATGCSNAPTDKMWGTLIVFAGGTGSFTQIYVVATLEGVPSDVWIRQYPLANNQLEWTPWRNTADGGNAATVNGLTVQTAVPKNAVFTDTTYGNASASAAGLVSTGAQTLAGNKTFNDQVIPAGASAVGTAQARKIYAGTSDMTAGTTALETGAIYLVYE